MLFDTERIDSEIRKDVAIVSFNNLIQYARCQTKFPPRKDFVTYHAEIINKITNLIRDNFDCIHHEPPIGLKNEGMFDKYLYDRFNESIIAIIGDDPLSNEDGVRFIYLSRWEPITISLSIYGFRATHLLRVLTNSDRFYILPAKCRTAMIERMNQVLYHKV